MASDPAVQGLHVSDPGCRLIQLRMVEDSTDAAYNGCRGERGRMSAVDPIPVADCVASRRVANNIAPRDGGFRKTRGGASGFGQGAGLALQLAMQFFPIGRAWFMEAVVLERPPRLMY